MTKHPTALCALALLLALAGWFFMTFKVVPAGEDGYLLLRAKQATECETGGGCTIYSDRELKTAIYAILLKLGQQGKPGLTS